MKTKLLLYLPMNNTLMWHLIKINRPTASLKEKKKTIHLHQRDRICLKCKGWYAKGQFCLQSTHFPSASKPPDDTEILMSNWNKTASFLLICCKQWLMNSAPPLNPPLNLVEVLYATRIWKMPFLSCVSTIKSAQWASVKSAPAFKNHRIPPTRSWEGETPPYLDGQLAVGGEHFSPRFREHSLQPLFHHLKEPAGPRIVSSAHKLQNWSTEPPWAHQQL